MSVDVTAAVLERLRGSLPGGNNSTPGPGDIIVYDGTVGPNPPTRYVVVLGDPGSRGASTVEAVSRDRAFTVQCDCVVVAPYVAGDCRWLASKVQDALTDFRPVVDGLSVGLFEHSVGRRPVPDESVPDRHVWSSAQQFALLAARF